MNLRFQNGFDQAKLVVAANKRRICLIVLLAFFLPANILAQVTILKKSQPVQVHINDQTRDHNPVMKYEQALQSTDAHPPKDRSGIESSHIPYPLNVPLRRGLGNTAPGIYGISNFLDHNEAVPDQLSDWNCGDRTYDTDTLNHNGTDYQSAQFPWLTMANDGLVVVAAAEGTIVDIHDGEPDQQCSFDSNAVPNLVVLEHPDGSHTLYAHMKTGSVTPRKVGDKVEQGDYLGVAGSSGFSTGPHLHLGVLDASNRLIDPYAGSCNLLIDESWWQNQESYYEKGIVAVATHGAFPEYPPCPQQEIPHFKDVYSTTDTLFPSVTARDVEDTDTIDVEMRDPFDRIIFQEAFKQDEFAFAPNVAFVWGLQSSAALPEGMYNWQASFGGQVENHTFYVGAGPDPAPAGETDNNAFTGLWYDPLLDGEGYNVVTADGGTIVYFYGSDNRGNRIWLISDLIPGGIQAGQAISVTMFESTGGVFPTPVQSSRGLSAWGTLSILFNDCENGQASLNGVDGNKISQIIKLAGIAGAGCTSGAVPADAAWSGLWYDPTRDGEGYNLIVAPVGRILYFYGFKASGLRLWLISDLITETLQPGTTVEIDLFEATQGSFTAPVPSGDALVKWGTAKITVLDCDKITIVIEGSDGSKTSNTVRLAGIIGSVCTG